MHLPGPIRAAVGLVASAAEEARHLPDKAIELPMLAISTALQASLRAQQRYARYAALGDQVLNRRTPTEQPPSWATFDEPVSVEEIRRSAISDFPQAGALLDDRFGVDDPTAVDEPAEAPAKPKATGEKSTTKKSSPKKASAKKASAKKTASAKEPAARKPSPKSVNKPRHTAASAFDNAADDDTED